MLDLLPNHIGVLVGIVMLSEDGKTFVGDGTLTEHPSAEVRSGLPLGHPGGVIGGVPLPLSEDDKAGVVSLPSASRPN